MKRTIILFLFAMLGVIGIQAANRKMNVDEDVNT